MNTFQEERRDAQRFQNRDKSVTRIVEHAALLALASFGRADRELLVKHAAKAMGAGDLAGAAAERARGAVAAHVVVGVQGRLEVEVNNAV